MRLFKSTLLTAIAASACVGFSAPAQAQVDPMLSQMTLFAGNFCPRGWTATDGQILPISSYQALFSLLGTTYGGDGRTTFGLPDLRGRAPLHLGQGPGLSDYRLGQKGGSTTYTVGLVNMPSHTHTGSVAASPQLGDTTMPVRNSIASAINNENIFVEGAPAINNMHRDTVRIGETGGSQAVNKVSPYLAMYWCIAIQGTFPSRN